MRPGTASAISLSGSAQSPFGVSMSGNPVSEGLAESGSMPPAEPAVRSATDCIRRTTTRTGPRPPFCASGRRGRTRDSWASPTSSAAEAAAFPRGFDSRHRLHPDRACQPNCIPSNRSWNGYVQAAQLHSRLLTADRCGALRPAGASWSRKRHLLSSSRILCGPRNPLNCGRVSPVPDSARSPT